MSRYTPPQSDEPEESVLGSLAPMRQRRPVVFWVVLLGAFAMLLTTVSSFLIFLLS